MRLVVGEPDLLTQRQRALRQGLGARRCRQARVQRQVDQVLHRLQVVAGGVVQRQSLAEGGAGAVGIAQVGQRQAQAVEQDGALRRLPMLQAQRQAGLEVLHRQLRRTAAPGHQPAHPRGGDLAGHVAGGQHRGMRRVGDGLGPVRRGPVQQARAQQGHGRVVGALQQRGAFHAAGLELMVQRQRLGQRPLRRAVAQRQRMAPGLGQVLGLGGQVAQRGAAGPGFVGAQALQLGDEVRHMRLLHAPRQRGIGLQVLEGELAHERVPAQARTVGRGPQQAVVDQRGDVGIGQPRHGAGAAGTEVGPQHRQAAQRIAQRVGQQLPVGVEGGAQAALAWRQVQRMGGQAVQVGGQALGQIGRRQGAAGARRQLDGQRLALQQPAQLQRVGALRALHLAAAGLEQAQGVAGVAAAVARRGGRLHRQAVQRQHAVGVQRQPHPRGDHQPQPRHPLQARQQRLVAQPVLEVVQQQQRGLAGQELGQPLGRRHIAGQGQAQRLGDVGHQLGMAGGGAGHRAGRQPVQLDEGLAGTRMQGALAVEQLGRQARLAAAGRAQHGDRPRRAGQPGLQLGQFGGAADKGGEVLRRALGHRIGRCADAGLCLGGCVAWPHGAGQARKVVGCGQAQLVVHALAPAGMALACGGHLAAGAQRAHPGPHGGLVQRVQRHQALGPVQRGQAVGGAGQQLQHPVTPLAGAALTGLVQPLLEGIAATVQALQQRAGAQPGGGHRIGTGQGLAQALQVAAAQPLQAGAVDQMGSASGVRGPGQACFGQPGAQAEQGLAQVAPRGFGGFVRPEQAGQFVAVDGAGFHRQVAQQAEALLAPPGEPAPAHLQRRLAEQAQVGQGGGAGHGRQILGRQPGPWPSHAGWTHQPAASPAHPDARH